MFEEEKRVRKQQKTILWPAYFDVSKTRKEGRRVPKSIAVPSPRIAELQKVAEKLGMKPEVNEDAAHPPTHWQKTGRLWVQRKGTKTQTLMKIAKELSVFRQKHVGNVSP
jgi:signal recognition particle subunit SRP19